jgi:hypothetical protein
MYPKMVLVAMVFLQACAAIKVDGYSIGASSWQHAQQDVTSQASFALHCAPEQLELHVLEVQRNNYPNYPSSIGVSGCGHRAVYKRTMNGWAANTIETELPVRVTK